MSDDVERLLGWFGDGSLLRPDPRLSSTVDLSRAMARVGGVTDVAPPGPGEARIRAALGEPAHLLFVLIDGLGLEQLDALPAGSFLRRRLALELRTVFPSATASAITSLATGEWPARHGVPGWWTHLPERDLTLTALPFLERWSGRHGSELGLGLDVFPCRTLLGRYRRDTHVLQPAPIVDSIYSRWFRGPTASSGYQDLPDALARALSRVRTAPAPSFTYLYFSSVDELSHAHGPRSPQVRALVAELDRRLEELARGLPPGARLALSADHGLIEVPEAEKDLLRPEDPLLELMRAPPAGEPRFPQLHVRAGQTDRFAALFGERFGARWALLRPEQLEELGLLGPDPLSAETRARVGDFVAVPEGRRVLLYRPGPDPTGTERLIGYHGGLLPDEVRIPLIVA